MEIKIKKKHFNLKNALIILSIISFIITVHSYYLQHQSLPTGLHISFHSNDLKFIDNTTYAKVEVSNDLGYPLENVKGYGTLSCKGFKSDIETQPFILEGPREILGEGGQSEFLLSDDNLLVDFVKTINSPCSDALFIAAKYSTDNFGNRSLEWVKKYLFFQENDSIFKVNHNINDSIYSTLCLYCNVSIIIEGNIKNKIEQYNYTKKERFAPSNSRIDFVQVSPTYGDSSFPIKGESGTLITITKSIPGTYNKCSTNTTKRCSDYLCELINERFNEHFPCSDKPKAGVKMPFDPLAKTNLSIG